MTYKIQKTGESSYQELKDQFGDFEHDADFILEGLKISFLNQVLSIMKEKDISNRELARRMKCSPQWVGKVLNQVSNFQLETIAKMASALECPNIKIYLRNNTPCDDFKNSITKESA